MTQSISRRLGRLQPWLGLGLLLVVVVLFVAACAGLPGAGTTLAPGQTATPVPSATLPPAGTPLHPANPSDPFSLLAFLFTPIFQALFISLVAVQQATGSMVIAIIAVTLLVRVILIPLYRKQIVSQKRMQLLGPELKEIQKRFKGDRVKVQEATQAFYKERGVNPASGCLPLILQFMLLIPMYSVFSSGLQNFDPNGMLRVFGVQLIKLNCPATPVVLSPGHVQPCINSTVFGIDLSQPQVLITIGIGISALAIISSLLQLVQSRMTLPRTEPGAVDDQNTKIQRQSMLFLPFISIFYGGFLPAGLFIYWIVSTLFSLVQQYLIIGWGGLFPLLGWDPAFARVHKPRFPVAIPAADPTKRAANSVLTQTDERAAKAATTIRPRERGGRQGRRGRRR
ncbi:MAG TPA: YidC/Oxa1 family membrane protein insertase [Candidatus Limnocylindrales bacterium]|nr:YidC/Oxa1 family membrane protein insertase [Candidatus Limnocylindrales bacterium]